MQGRVSSASTGVRAPPRMHPRRFRRRAEGAILPPWRNGPGAEGGRAADRHADRTGRHRSGPRGSARTGGRVPDGTRSGPACDPPEATGSLPGPRVAGRSQGRPPRGPGSGRSPAHRRPGLPTHRPDLSGGHPAAGSIAQGPGSDPPADAPGPPDPSATLAVRPAASRARERSFAGLVPGTSGARPDPGPSPATPRQYRDPAPAAASRAPPACRHRPEDAPHAGPSGGGRHPGSGRGPSPDAVRPARPRHRTADGGATGDRPADGGREAAGSRPGIRIGAGGAAGRRDPEVATGRRQDRSGPAAGRSTRGPATTRRPSPAVPVRRGSRPPALRHVPDRGPSAGGPSSSAGRRLPLGPGRPAAGSGPPGPVPGPAASRPPACAGPALRRGPPARRGLCDAGDSEPVRPRPPKPGRGSRADRGAGSGPGGRPDPPNGASVVRRDRSVPASYGIRDREICGRGPVPRGTPATLPSSPTCGRGEDGVPGAEGSALSRSAAPRRHRHDPHAPGGVPGRAAGPAGDAGDHGPRGAPGPGPRSLGRPGSGSLGGTGAAPRVRPGRVRSAPPPDRYGTVW